MNPVAFGRVHCHCARCGALDWCSRQSMVPDEFGPEWRALAPALPYCERCEIDLAEAWARFAPFTAKCRRCGAEGACKASPLVPEDPRQDRPVPLCTRCHEDAVKDAVRELTGGRDAA